MIIIRSLLIGVIIVVKISTSILSNPNIETVLKLNQTNTDYIHIDVMDGVFVSNKIFTIDDIYKINNYSTKPLDIHLMVKDINSYVDNLLSLKPAFLTLHYEALIDDSVLTKIRANGIKCGLSVKPNTDIKDIFNLLPKIDLVLIMSEEPGQGGQTFMVSSLDKIKLLKDEINKYNLNVLISVDGGIDNHTAPLCTKIGADMLVVGTFIIKEGAYQDNIDKLRQ